MTSAAMLARLAALHPIDRDWLLESLPVETRARLVSALRSDSDEEMSASPGDPQTAVSTAEASDVVAVLQVEPAWLAGMVLRMQPWPWSAAVLKSLPFEHRPSLAVGGSQSVKPMLAGVILGALARRLPPYEVAVSMSQRTPRFDDLVQQIGSGRSTSEPLP